MRKFVVVATSDCGTFCEGIYDDYYTALGKAMDIIYEFKESYKKDGDEFVISDPTEDEGQYGIIISVYYKACCWKKGETENFYILFFDEPRTENRKNGL